MHSTIMIALLLATPQAHAACDLDRSTEEVFSCLNQQLADAQAYIATLEEVLYVDGDGDVVIDGANLRVQAGNGNTWEEPNGKGNVIIGYDELYGNDKSGSHNLVIGPYHSYSSYGSIVAGYYNAAEGPYSSVTGGAGNVATARGAVVSGGYYNTATDKYAGVFGGRLNESTGYISAILGGYGLTVSENYEVSAGSDERFVALEEDVTALADEVSGNAVSLAEYASLIDLNAAEISANTLSLSDNAAAIAANAADLEAALDAIAGHTSLITQNEEGIAANADAIASIDLSDFVTTEQMEEECEQGNSGSHRNDDHSKDDDDDKSRDH
jgi:hypothetical protein